MLGDYNMVERKADKSSLCGKTMPAQERLLFNALKESIQVAEYPRTVPTLTYSWDNARSDGARVMARLDRVYVFPDSPTSRRKILQYRIRGDHTRSDHCPVYMEIELASTCSRPSRWVMSLAHLDAAAPAIRKVWTELPSQSSFFSKLHRVSRFYRKFGIQRARKYKAEE